MNNIISFLDLQITRLPTAIDINIYRKPTTTNTTINFRSNHSIEHKMAAYRYLINTMLTLPLTPANRRIEWHKILTITNNNNFPLQLITNMKRKLRQKAQTTEPKNDNFNKLAIFTFHSPKIRKITNLFKQTNIRIAYRGTNTLRQQAERINRYNRDTKDPSQNYKKGGVYKMECKTCNKAYIGQTSKDITQRYREHIRYIRNNDPNPPTQNIFYATYMNMETSQKR